MAMASHSSVELINLLSGYDMDFDILKLFLECSPDVNVRDDSGNTPLIAAILHQRDYVIAYVISKGR